MYDKFAKNFRLFLFIIRVALLSVGIRRESGRVLRIRIFNEE
jgi:hypothetical protein